jgi:hypothetical protein
MLHVAYLIGIGLYSFLFVYTIIQLNISSLSKWNRRRRRVPYFNYKRTFHFVHVLFCLSQIGFNLTHQYDK